MPELIERINATPYFLCIWVHLTEFRLVSGDQLPKHIKERCFYLPFKEEMMFADKSEAIGFLFDKYNAGWELNWHRFKEQWNGYKTVSVGLYRHCD